MGLILSIDVATTQVKAALVDADGCVVGGTKSATLKIEGDSTGRTEHDPDKLINALLKVCQLAIGDKGSEVEALALTSYMFGLVLTDRDHRALTNISTFVDTTAQAHHAEFLTAIGDVGRMYAKTGCPPLFQYPINRLHHIANKKPAIKSQAAHILDSKAFLMHVLTGEYCTDYSTASSMGCLDTAGNWDAEIITIAGFDLEQFPRVSNGFSEKIPLRQNICQNFGLKKGTCVFVGLYNGGALAASLSAFEARIAVGNFGTSGMFRIPSDAPIQDSESGIIQSCLLKSGLFLTGGGINNCSIATSLLLNVLGLKFSYLRNKELSIPGSNGVMTFPYFTGERDKIIGNIGTGMIFGLGAATTRDDLARSFLEGVAFSFLLIKRRLDPKNEIKELRLGGGESSNLPWMQILADVLNVPIRLTKTAEISIVGAAALARHQDGSGLLVSSQRVMENSSLLNPNATNALIYQEVAERYLNVRSSLREPLLARQGLSSLKSLKRKPLIKELPLDRSAGRVKREDA